MSDNADRQCEYVSPEGVRCRAWKVSGSSQCFMHTPELRDQAQAARERGGKRAWSMELGKWEDVEIKTLEDCRTFLSRAINDMRAGRIPPQMLTSISAGVQALAKVLDMSDLTSRIEKIEERMERRSP